MRPHLLAAASLSLALAPACTEKTSRLEQASQAQQAAAERDRPPPPPLRPHTAALPPAPAGIDPTLWRDIGWFPADTVDVAAFITPQWQSLVRWLEQQLVADFPACGPLLAGARRTYMAHQGADRVATNVLYGSMTREQERACMDVALKALSTAGVQDGDLTTLTTPEGDQARLAWFTRGDETVVLLEGDSPIAGWISPAGSLADNPELVRLIADVDKDAAVWTVGLQDLGTALTGVASTGYMLTLAPQTEGGKPGIRGQARLLYRSHEDAFAAERGAAELMQKLVKADDPVSFTAKAEGTALEISLAAALDINNRDALMTWSQRVLAAMPQPATTPAKP